MLDRLFAALQELHAPGGDAVCFGLDSTSAEVHLDGTGAQSIGKSCGGWYAKIHMVAGAPLVMDRACEGDETRQLVRDLGMTPVVPPKANRKAEWEYDRKTYKLRNEIERLFRRFKGCRCLFTRFDKLDATYRDFLNLAAVFEMTHDLA